VHEDAKRRSTQYSCGFEAMPSLHPEARKRTEIKSKLTPKLTPESDVVDAAKVYLSEV
jgi:hypothetical protein